MQRLQVMEETYGHSCRNTSPPSPTIRVSAPPSSNGQMALQHQLGQQAERLEVIEKQLLRNQREDMGLRHEYDTTTAMLMDVRESSIPSLCSTSPVYVSIKKLRAVQDDPSSPVLAMARDEGRFSLFYVLLCRVCFLLQN
jgi:hypothetical protein